MGGQSHDHQRKIVDKRLLGLNAAISLGPWTWYSRSTYQMSICGPYLNVQAWEFFWIVVFIWTQMNIQVVHLNRNLVQDFCLNYSGHYWLSILTHHTLYWFDFERLVLLAIQSKPCCAPHCRALNKLIPGPLPWQSIVKVWQLGNPGGLRLALTRQVKLNK